jgi:4-coumarate--CoA ligase
MLWKSPHPDLESKPSPIYYKVLLPDGWVLSSDIVPTTLTTWEWAFESREFSPIHYAPSSLGSYSDAVTKKQLDFSEVKRLASQLSTVLVRKYGLKPQQTVSLFSTNTIWYPVAMWAAVRAGGRVNGASPAYSVEEMAHALKTAEAKFLMTLPSSLDVAVAAATEAGIPKSHILLLEGSAAGFTSIQDLISQFQDAGHIVAPYYRIPTGKTNMEICGYLNFSSGTTGFPKAVMLSHHNVIAQVSSFGS